MNTIYTIIKTLQLDYHIMPPVTRSRSRAGAHVVPYKPKARKQARGPKRKRPAPKVDIRTRWDRTCKAYADAKVERANVMARLALAQQALVETSTEYVQYHKRYTDAVVAAELKVVKTQRLLGSWRNTMASGTICGIAFRGRSEVDALEWRLGHERRQLEEAKAARECARLKLKWVTTEFDYTSAAHLVPVLNQSIRDTITQLTNLRHKIEELAPQMAAAPGSDWTAHTCGMLLGSVEW